MPSQKPPSWVQIRAASDAISTSTWEKYAFPAAAVGAVLLILGGYFALPGLSPPRPEGELTKYQTLATASQTAKPASDTLVGTPAELSIQSRPSRTGVWLGADSIGRTPIWSIDLPPGRHFLSLRRPGYRDLDTVLVLRPGMTDDLRFRLDRRPR